MNKAIISIIILLASGGAILFIHNQPSVPGNKLIITEPVIKTAQSTTTQNEAPATTVKEFTITGSSYAFDPATITVNKGDHVKIIFKNSGGFHDWKIDELGVATKRIKEGEQDVVEFIADKAGTFEYYCSVGKHRAMGMRGTLIVI